MGLFSKFKPSKSTVVVDGLSLYESAGMKGKVAPRTQLQMLRRLSRFAQQEKVPLVAVLSGTPLHKAPNGKKFDDIRVVYSKSEDAHAKFLVKTTKSQGSSAVLVVGSEGSEKTAIGAGLRTLRISTFRKACDIGNLEGGDNSGGNNRNSGRDRNRSQRRRPQQDKKQQQPEPQKKNNETDAINELIDLVD